MSAPSAVVTQLGGQTTTGVTVTVASVLGVAVFAGVVAGLVALAYRWYVRERVPTGLPLLAGLAVVAVSLSTTTLLANEIAPDGPDIELVTALVHVATFLISGLAAAGGTRFGDRLGVDLFAATGVSDVDADVSEIVQTVGRVTTVQLPKEIADIVGYDPVTEETKETLSERRFLFPRRLSKAELRERLVSRLKTDYGVGHVDVEFGDDGSVEFLAVGSRAAGIGPTLPPATNAVAIRADPAHAASAGDLVQVWETDPTKRVLTGELRGVAGDVVTVAIDAADTPRLNPTDRYKLVTLPVQDRPDREFASLLRSADETLATVTVEAGSDLDGASIDALDVTVAAITRTDRPPEPLPARDRTLESGDVVYAIATPETLRKIENAGRGPDDTPASASRTSEAAGPDPRPTGRDAEPVDPDPGRADSAAESAEPDGATGPNDGAAGTDAGEPDAPSSETQANSEPAADADPLSGDAFPDADDLPGMDVRAPTIPSDSEPEAGDGQADEDGDASADERDDGSASEEAGGVDDALAEKSTDDLLDESADDPLFDDPVGETDDDETRSDGEAPDDDSVPFTPLDVGEDDPLSDPLLGGDADDADGDGDGATDDADGERDR